MRSRTAALLFAFAASTAAAQRTEASRSAPPPGVDSLIVSLLTMGPGEQLFDRFGHTAIRVRRPRTGLDSAWNWGMYDFAAPNFIPRFLTGDTQYWMAGFTTMQFVNYYRAAQRDVWEQELALTPAQSDSLLTFLRWNARSENKFYRYDYYLDNCSTRVRDALDAVLGGALKSSLSALTLRNGATFRGETLRLTQAFPLISFGMTFALGPRADAQITPWDETFIPMRLRDLLRQVRVAGSSGVRPLVSRESKLVDAGQYTEVESVPSYSGRAALTGLAIAIVLVLLGAAAGRYSIARAALAISGSAWHLTLGIAGTLVLLAGLFTRHTFMGANTAVLLGTPASIALGWYYARGWSRTATARTRKIAISLSWIALWAALAPGLLKPFNVVTPADDSPANLVMLVQVVLAILLRRGAAVKQD